MNCLCVISGEIKMGEKGDGGWGETFEMQISFCLIWAKFDARILLFFVCALIKV